MGEELNIAVLGAGSWGTTLGVLLDENGHHVTLWEVFPEHVDAILRDRENKKFLPGIEVAPSIGVTSALDEAIDG